MEEMLAREIADASMEDVVVERQVRLHGYVLDFLFTCSSRRSVGQVVGPSRAICLNVEVDGHEWHERTRQQASYDRARDREMLRRGIFVVRFTGSDVHRDVNQCAKEIRQTFRDLCQLWAWDATPQSILRIEKAAEFTRRSEHVLGLVHKNGAVSISVAALDLGLSANALKPVFRALVDGGVLKEAGRRGYVLRQIGKQFILDKAATPADGERR